MGAVTFSLDVQLVKALTNVFSFCTFVETGTFKGDTIATMLPFFNELISVELSDTLYQDACHRFENEPKVKMHLGDSPKFLFQIFTLQHDKSTLYWLDAHWCIADNTAGQTSQCPLLQEIGAIQSLNDQSIILIDDARLFLSPPPTPHEISQWPVFNDILIALRKLSSSHKMMVINDVIAFYPPSAHLAMETYARESGIDWLHASQSLTGYYSLLQQLEEKEEVIQYLKSVTLWDKIQKKFKHPLLQHLGCMIKKMQHILGFYRKA